MVKRKRIDEGEQIQVKMIVQDRELIREHTTADSDYADRLQEVPGRRDLSGEYTLEDLEDLLGFIAAEANHTEDAKLRRRLDRLHEKLYKVQRSYDDGNWNDSE
ncbi:MAG: hypothetical protein O2782_17760 [bacterium]|nr:hypothetical protein [bacterium]